MTTPFLQREPDAADRERWRASLAEIPASAEHTGLVPLFVFRVGEERLGIEPRHVELAVPMPVLHSIPHRGAELAGVVNVRGAVTLCFSIADILGIPPGPAVPRPMLLVLVQPGWRVACRVDFSEGILEFDRSALMPVPSTLQATGRRHVKGIFPAEPGDVRWIDAGTVFEAFDAAAR